MVQPIPLYLLDSLVYYAGDAAYFGANAHNAIILDWSVETIYLYATIAARSAGQVLRLRSELTGEPSA